MDILNDNFSLKTGLQLDNIVRIMRVLDEKYKSKIAGLRGDTVLLRCKNVDIYNEFCAEWKSLERELLL